MPASIASHRTPAELCRFCDALNVHGFNRTQRYSVQFSVQFELTESAQTPYLHLEFFDEQIAFIPFHYAVISMDEWNEWNEFDKRQKTDFRTKKKCQSLNGAFKCSSPALSLLRMEDYNKIQPLYYMYEVELAHRKFWIEKLACVSIEIALLLL